MRTPGSAAVLEARRLLAAKLLSEGIKVSEVAWLVGAGHSSVKRWKSVLTKEGLAGLAAKPRPPPPTKLIESQHARLLQILIAGPLASGYSRTNFNWANPLSASSAEPDQSHLCSRRNDLYEALEGFASRYTLLASSSRTPLPASLGLTQFCSIFSVYVSLERGECIRLTQ